MSDLPAIAGGRLRRQEPAARGPARARAEALDGDGEETRLVGGAVRDLALGLPPGDFDLATTARPEVVDGARARRRISTSRRPG